LGAGACRAKAVSTSWLLMPAILGAADDDDDDAKDHHFDGNPDE
jgi:hypothetical protein